MGAQLSCFRCFSKPSLEQHRAALETIVRELLSFQETEDTPPSRATGNGAVNIEPAETNSHCQQRDICALMDSGDVQTLCAVASRELLKQPTVLDTFFPIEIVGDIHGQFQDLLHIFHRLGHPPHTRYLFLGDYVDRGPQSLEVIVLLLALKCLYPDSVFLLRGNHECETVSLVYGFFGECRERFRPAVWKAFIPVFDAMPIAAVVRPPGAGAAPCGHAEGSAAASGALQTDPCSGAALFCVHAGLSPVLRSIADVRRVRRPCKTNSSQLVKDLLWSDPNPTSPGWGIGDRGVSCTYGLDVARRFLEGNGCGMIVRAHEVKMQGYELLGEGDGLVATVFSAPGYAGVCTNDGAVLSIDQHGARTWKIFEFSGADQLQSEELEGPLPNDTADGIALPRRSDQIEELMKEDLVPLDPNEIHVQARESLKEVAEDLLGRVRHMGEHVWTPSGSRSASFTSGKPSLSHPHSSAASEDRRDTCV